MFFSLFFKALFGMSGFDKVASVVKADQFPQV